MNLKTFSYFSLWKPFGVRWVCYIPEPVGEPFGRKTKSATASTEAAAILLYIHNILKLSQTQNANSNIGF